MIVMILLKCEWHEKRDIVVQMLKQIMQLILGLQMVNIFNDVLLERKCAD